MRILKRTIRPMILMKKMNPKAEDFPAEAKCKIINGRQLPR